MSLRHSVAKTQVYDFPPPLLNKCLFLFRCQSSSLVLSLDEVKVIDAIVLFL